VVSLRDFAAAPVSHLALDAAHFAEKLKAAPAANHAGTRARSNSVYAAPGNQVERTIAEAWQAVLGVKSVGVHDNFFDLGGNSLLGIQLMSMLRKAFLLELPMSSLFEAPTVAEQAVVVSEMNRKEDELKELERMLSEIEGLSPEDLENRLALMERQSGAEAV
jgi:acyl carrier protein